MKSSQESRSIGLSKLVDWTNERNGGYSNQAMDVAERTDGIMLSVKKETLETYLQLHTIKYPWEQAKNWMCYTQARCS
jgi:hypothetical protein